MPTTLRTNVRVVTAMKAPIVTKVSNRMFTTCCNICNRSRSKIPYVNFVPSVKGNCFFFYIADIDECQSGNPCQNGGSCQNTDGGYACTCRSRYTGNNCEHSIVCDSSIR